MNKRFVLTFYNKIKGKREDLTYGFESEIKAREWIFNTDIDKIDFYDDIRIE